MRPHFLTADQVMIAAWDEQSESLKFTPSKQTSFDISLRAEEGDSVIAQGRSFTMPEGEASCAGMSSICLYGEGIVSVSPSPSGDDWYALTITALEPKAICAIRIKLEGTGRLVING